MDELVGMARRVVNVDLLSVEPDHDHQLAVAVSGSKIAVMLDGKRVLLADDATHARGSVGLRVVNTHARFSDLSIKAR